VDKFIELMLMLDWMETIRMLFAFGRGVKLSYKKLYNSMSIVECWYACSRLSVSRDARWLRCWLWNCSALLKLWSEHHAALKNWKIFPLV